MAGRGSWEDSLGGEGLKLAPQCCLEGGWASEAPPMGHRAWGHHPQSFQGLVLGGGRPYPIIY